MTAGRPPASSIAQRLAPPVSPRFRYGVVEYIDCAHHLDGAGLCESVHGHTYKVEVLAQGPCQDGQALDLDRLKEQTRACLRRFDHTDLNKLFNTPTCENFCQAIFDELRRDLPNLRLVRVWEGHGKWAEQG